MITADDIYDYLESYEIDSTEISSTWIENRIANSIVPLLEKKLGFELESATEKTVILSGTGKDYLILPDKVINSITSIKYTFPISENYYEDSSNYELINGGIIKLYGRYFPTGDKNIEVIYNIGSATLTGDLKELVIMQTCIKVLSHLANRTGGGAINVNAYNKQYGDRGMYTHEINQLHLESLAIIKSYRSGVTSI